jgi:hypothetical protein
MLRVSLIFAACSATALAQNTVFQVDPGAPAPQIQLRTADVPMVAGVGIEAAMVGPATGIAGAPYSAQFATERVQTLADGNRIQQTFSGTVARDSQGRIRREEALPPLPGSSGDSPRLVRIEDPVAGVHWTLDAQTKTAIKMPFPTLNKGVAGTALPPPPPGGEQTFFYSSTSGGKAGVEIVSRAPGAAPDANTTKTDLGTQTVGGVSAQGTRITRTIPAGTVGNEQPITITTETWYSPDLHVLVLSKSSDPRIGDTTYTLTNIQRAEPAASLFQVPDDYTIKDQPINTLIQLKSAKPLPQ